jgi:hypothetical protein
METLEFLFTDAIKTLNRRQKDLPLAMEVTRDIGQTYDETLFRQWHEFSQSAQEMAWCGLDPGTILGAAIYTGENTYVRSIADMVAEFVEIKPAAVSTLEHYNPFTEQEVNARVHHRKCLEDFRSLFMPIRPLQAVEILKVAAGRQNVKLSTGNPTGWCAYAVMAAVSAIEANPEENSEPLKKRAMEAFEIALYEMPWTSLCDYGRHVLHYRRRDGKPLTLDSMIRLARKREMYSFVQFALEKAEF